jgi:hypothetical protein
MEVPSVSRERAAPPRFGLKAGSIAPVVASKAKIRLRTTSSEVFPNVPAGLTDVNVPAAMILLPTWVIASTDPFMTCGVRSPGFADTTPVPRSALTAPACGEPSPRSVREATSRTAPRPRRRVCMVGLLSVWLSWPVPEPCQRPAEPTDRRRVEHPRS